MSERCSRVCFSNGFLRLSAVPLHIRSTSNSAVGPLISRRGAALKSPVFIPNTLCRSSLPQLVPLNRLFLNCGLLGSSFFNDRTLSSTVHANPEFRLDEPNLRVPSVTQSCSSGI